MQVFTKLMQHAPKVLVLVQLMCKLSVALPVIYTIIPTVPVVMTTLNPLTFTIPPLYNGIILTCLAGGLPTPDIMWIDQQGQVLNNSIYSTCGDGIGSASLVLHSDIDEPTIHCVAVDSFGEQSIPVRISKSGTSMKSYTFSPTLINSISVNFTLRVLTHNCPQWNDAYKTYTEEQVQRALRYTSTYSSKLCSIGSSYSLAITNTICSREVAGAVVYFGTISSTSASHVQQLVNGLEEWFYSNPALLLGDTPYMLNLEGRLVLKTSPHFGRGLKATSTSPPTMTPSTDCTSKKVTQVTTVMVLSLLGAIFITLEVTCFRIGYKAKIRKAKIGFIRNDIATTRNEVELGSQEPARQEVMERSLSGIEEAAYYEVQGIEEEDYYMEFNKPLVCSEMSQGRRTVEDKPPTLPHEWHGIEEDVYVESDQSSAFVRNGQEGDIAVQYKPAKPPLPSRGPEPYTSHYVEMDHSHYAEMDHSHYAEMDHIYDIGMSDIYTPVQYVTLQNPFKLSSIEDGRCHSEKDEAPVYADVSRKPNSENDELSKLSPCSSGKGLELDLPAMYTENGRLPNQSNEVVPPPLPAREQASHRMDTLNENEQSQPELSLSRIQKNELSKRTPCSSGAVDDSNGLELDRPTMCTEIRIPPNQWKGMVPPPLPARERSLPDPVHTTNEKEQSQSEISLSRIEKDSHCTDASEQRDAHGK